MFQKKSTPPTHETRLASAGAVAGAAISIFHEAIEDLEHAASNVGDVVADIDTEVADLEAKVAQLKGLAAHAVEQQGDHLNAATKIRSLFA